MYKADFINTLGIMNDELIKDLECMKRTRQRLCALSDAQRKSLLASIAEGLARDKDSLIASNQEDLKAIADGPVKKRLALDEQKIADLQKGIEHVCTLADPIGEVLEKRKLDEGLILTRISASMGTICMIFEARPEALVQITSLCLRSGNAVVLKGGKEAQHTNKALFDSIKRSIAFLEKDSTWVALARSREDVDDLLKCEKLIDLVVPRGSNALVRHVMENTRIPVLGHSSGLCTIYVDKSADLKKSLDVLLDAKITYPAACNAVETILVHKDIAGAFLPRLQELFEKNGIKIHADRQACLICPAFVEATDKDFDTEYLGLEAALSIVDSIQEAIEHINSHGSHHTDAIMAEDDQAARVFLRDVDSAGVYRNASTRFADGYRYGLGAEIGISTSKLHARGPVGLRGLMTEKWILEGSGQVSATYTGKNAKPFCHEDLI